MVKDPAEARSGRFPFLVPDPHNTPLSVGERQPSGPTLTVWPEGTAIRFNRNRGVLPDSARRCTALSASGDRCRRAAMRGSDVCAVHAGLTRSEVVEFTADSRRNLMHTLARIDRRADGLLVTLTWPSWAAPDRAGWYDAVDRLRKRLQRRFPKAGCVWKREATAKGVVHLHLLVYGMTAGELQSWLPAAWTDATRVDRGDLDAAGAKDVRVHVEAARRFCAAKQYIGKYIGKRGQTDAQPMGRWWGVLGSNHIPWSAEVVVGVSDATVIRMIRSGRKWLEANRRRRGIPRFRHQWSADGLTLVVSDPDAWWRLANLFEVYEHWPEDGRVTRQDGPGRAQPRGPLVSTPSPDMAAAAAVGASAIAT